MEEAVVGLRERKKRQTREAIVDAAMGLFEERGFEATTIADIAAAADIAPRTFFAYFPSKDDVVFHDHAETFDSLEARLREREPGETAIDAMRAWIAGEMEESDPDDPRERCRRRLVAENEPLAAHDRHLMGRFETALAAAVADDLGGAADDLRATMVAAAATAALHTLGESYKDEDGAKTLGDDPMGVVDDAMTFLRGGLAALQARDAPPPRRKR